MINFWSRYFLKRFLPLILAACFLTITVHSVTAQITPGTARPKVILISLDGATPWLINDYFSKGVLSPNQGLGLLKSQGIVAQQNITCNPSLTAACHIAVGTGSTTARTDINSNSFHLVASPFLQTISGFGAPIGGYSLGIDGPAPNANPTAEPIWIGLRENGKKVAAATFPGADGVDVRVPGVSNSPIVQPAKERTVDYTVPFGTFGGVGAKGFNLTSANFNVDATQASNGLKAIGINSFSSVRVASLESIPATGSGSLIGGGPYNLQVAALDTTDDKIANYDTLVVFDANQGIKPGPYSLPATGPAIVRSRDKASSSFFFEGSPNKVGAAFYASYLASDLSTVRIARYSANYIPRNSAVLADVDDINNNVGFWAPQADFRITERLSPGFENFSDAELEAIYEDQVRTFVDYQTRVALRAIAKSPNADLVMVYIEQPDGSEHQFLLTDPRQATNPRNPNTIGAGQDQAKVTRYQKYVQTAYRAANNAVQRIISTVGTDTQGKPNSNIIVVFDHGFAPFHTAVDMSAYLRSKGFDLNKVRAVTSGPAANIYINLKGREPNGTVTPAEYVTLQQQVVKALQDAVDTNPNYTNGGSTALFDKIYSRPLPSNLSDPTFGVGTNEVIGQDAGDVFATLSLGYNFDGTQSPPVQRLGDTNTAFLSVPNFYGAHGYDPTIPKMSAIFFAAGPNIGRGTLTQIRNIDITPTIDQLLGVPPAKTVQGNPLNLAGT